MLLLLAISSCGCSLSSQDQLTSDFCDHLLSCDVADARDVPASAKDECVDGLIDDVNDGKMSWANLGRCEGCIDRTNNDCRDAREDRDCDTACAAVPLVTGALSSYDEVQGACSRFETACQMKGTDCEGRLLDWRLGVRPDDAKTGSRLFQNDATIHACARCINDLEHISSCTKGDDETCSNAASFSHCDALTSVCADVCALSPVLGAITAESRSVVSLCTQDWSCLDQPPSADDDALPSEADAGGQTAPSNAGSSPSSETPMIQYRRWSPHECYQAMMSNKDCKECKVLELQCAPASESAGAMGTPAAGAVAASCGDSSALCRSWLAGCSGCFAGLKVNTGFKVR